MDVSGAFSAIPGIVVSNGETFNSMRHYFAADLKGAHSANLQKEIYNNYSYIVSVVSDVFDTASDVVFNTYNKWLEFKSQKPEEYKKILGMIQDFDIKNGNDYWTNGRLSLNTEKHSEEMHEVWNFGLFYRLMRNFTGHRLDIPDLIDRATYFNDVTELRKRLMEADRNMNNSYISFDIENSFEFMNNSKANLCHDSVTVKIRPNLRADDKFNNLSVKYGIYIDIGSVIDTIIYNIEGLWSKKNVLKSGVVVTGITDQPTEKPEEAIEEADLFDKDNLRTKVSYYFREYFEKVAKHICIETLDNSITIRNGWDVFLKKLDKMYTNVLKCDNYVRLNNFLTSFKRTKGGNTIDMDSEKYANSFTTFIKLALDKEYSEIPIMDSEGFVDYILGARRHDYTTGEVNIKDTITNIVFALFFRAFAIYFETISNITLFESSVYRVKSYYSREFDRDYDFEALNTSIQTNNDYVCKDFFKNIISSYNQYKLSIYDTNRFKNGEKTSFMFAIYKRKLWMAYTTEMYAILDLKLKFEEAVQKYGAGLNDDAPEKVERYKRFFNEQYNYVLERIINNFALDSFSCGYVSNKIAFKRYSYKSDYTLLDNHFRDHICNITYDQSSNSYSRYIEATKWIEDMIKLISDWNGQKNDILRCVISYNKQDNADYMENDFKTPDITITGEFKKMLFELGLLDFETASYY